MSPAMRRKIRLQNPWSFLNVTLSPEDVEQDEKVSNQQLVLLARESLDRILAADAFDTDTGPAIYLYELSTDKHTQTAVIADIPVADYESGHVKIHEQVRTHRAELLAEHLYQLGVSSSPIALTYRNTRTLAGLISHCQNARRPTLRIPATHGVQQTVWTITDPLTIDQFVNGFSSLTLYIIDGHHRAAASTSVSKKVNGEPAQRLFGAMFPHDSLKLQGFNRWLLRDEQFDPAGLSETLRVQCSASTLASFQPPRQGEIVTYINGAWQLVVLPENNQFDSQQLFEQIFSSILNIQAPDDPRIINIPGDQPITELQRLVDQQGAAGFVMAPLTIDDFITAADQNILLPPKSTYFTPKVQSGLFLRSIR